MVAKVRLEFKLLSATKTTDGHTLTLNLKNVGNRILKSMVVRLHGPILNFPGETASCFVYALMPGADENVTFRAFASSLKRVHFSVCGYVSGDSYFSIESPAMTVNARKATEDNYILV